MQFSMKNLDQLSLNEMEELLSSSRKVIWQTEDNEAKYAWVAAVLKAQRYSKLGKRDKGIVRRFLQKVTAHQYALRMRIDRAKCYLRDPKATLAMASAAAGFADQSHFTKVFRMVGVAPAHFRVSA